MEIKYCDLCGYRLSAAEVEALEPDGRSICGKCAKPGQPASRMAARRTSSFLRTPRLAPPAPVLESGAARALQREEVSKRVEKSKETSRAVLFWAAFGSVLFVGMVILFMVATLRHSDSSRKVEAPAGRAGEKKHGPGPGAGAPPAIPPSPPTIASSPAPPSPPPPLPPPPPPRPVPAPRPAPRPTPAPPVPLPPEVVSPDDKQWLEGKNLEPGLWGEFAAHEIVDLKEARTFGAEHAEMVPALSMPRRQNTYFSSGVSDKFTGRFSGFILIRTPGDYNFVLVAEDSGVLEIDGKIVAEKWSVRDMKSVNGKIHLDAGLHPILVLHRQMEGNWALNLAMGIEGEKVHTVLRKDYYHTPPGSIPKAP